VLRQSIYQTSRRGATERVRGGIAQTSKRLGNERLPTHRHFRHVSLQWVTVIHRYDWTSNKFPTNVYTSRSRGGVRLNDAAALTNTVIIDSLKIMQPFQHEVALYIAFWPIGPSFRLSSVCSSKRAYRSWFGTQIPIVNVNFWCRELARWFDIIWVHFAAKALRLLQSVSNHTRITRIRLRDRGHTEVIQRSHTEVILNLCSIFRHAVILSAVSFQPQSVTALFDSINLGSEKPGFFKKPNPLRFSDFIGFCALLGIRIFYMNEQLGSLLVDLAHQLNLYLDSPL